MTHPARYYAGIFLVSLATLLLELSMTRILSVAFWPHFGFLAISMALLGFGAAGAVLAVWKPLREPKNLDLRLNRLAWLFGLSAPLMFRLSQILPLESLSGRGWQWSLLPLHLLVLSVPFFLSGLLIALLITRRANQMPRLYAADLAGAGMACWLLVPVMPAVGGVGAIWVVAAVGVLAAGVFAARMRGMLLALTAALALARIAPVAEHFWPLAVTAEKRQATAGMKRLFEAWNTFSFVEVYEQKQAPGWPASRWIATDGGTSMTASPDLSAGVQAYLEAHPQDGYYLSNIAYLHLDRPAILIIGSGAGREVLDGLRRKARAITCVEINPIVQDLVSRRMNDFWGGLFRQPAVKLVTEEGRSFINRSRERYDVIIASHSISNAAAATGMLNLSENYVLTREAFQEYLAHLSPGGVLFITWPETQMPRLLATAREALLRSGIQRPGQHFYLFRVREKAGAPMVAMVISQSAFRPDRIRQMEAYRKGMLPVYPENALLYAPFSDRQASRYGALLGQAGTRISPATDDRPFFHQPVSWKGIEWADWRLMFSGQAIPEGKSIAEMTLGFVFLFACLISLLLILLPLRWGAGAGLRIPGRGRFLLYFAALGLGFIMAEMALIQWFTLYLGQPVLSLSTILAGILFFSGAGSFVSGRIALDGRRFSVRYVPLLVGMLLGAAFLAPVLFEASIGWALPWRISLTLVFLAPLGLMLGMPFPTGIRLVNTISPAFIPWAWGINSFFTVIGSVFALILGMTVGFKLVIVVAACCYGVAGIALMQR